MDSIEKQAIKTFICAAYFVSNEWEDELSWSKHGEIKFSAFSHQRSSIKIALNSDWSREKYDLSLQRILKRFDQWATNHASREQRDYWINNSGPFPSTEILVSLQNSHSVVEAILELDELDPSLAQDLSRPR